MGIMWTMDVNLVFGNPFAKAATSPVEIEADWYFVSNEETESLFEASPNDSWRCYIALCRWAVFRSEEARLLTWSDVDWDAHTIRFTPPGRKKTTKRRTRMVPLVEKLYQLLLECFERSSGSANIVDLGNNNHIRDFRVIQKRAGVPRYAKPFQTLRKNCQSEWLEKYPVMNVCQWLGNSPGVAIKHYNKTTDELLSKVTGHGCRKGMAAAELAREILELSDEDARSVKELIGKLSNQGNIGATSAQHAWNAPKLAKKNP